MRKLFFTERNTGLDKPSKYPMLGRASKGAHIKVLLWYFTVKSVEFAAANPESYKENNICFNPFFGFLEVILT